MKGKIKTTCYGLCAVLLGIGLQACEKQETPVDNLLTPQEEAFKKAVVPYVQNTVRPTYVAMADAAVDMAAKCVVMQTNFAAGKLTSADVEAAGKAWNEARKYWEKSEAFLYGPANNHNIDPHIDSWPLDKTALDNTLAKIRNGEAWSIETMGYGLLGFHSVEYMLFELINDDTQSQARSIDKFTAEELKYLVAVAEDLRNQCVLLEACWSGMNNIAAAKQQMLEEAELDYNENYGDMMMNAGQAGSIYKTYQETAEEIIQGCIDIADEVGKTKIGRPANGSSEDDRNYIESPYSLNSIVDFEDNMHSIENSYFGTQAGDASLSDYIKSVNPTLDTKVRTLLTESINTIKAIPEPFAKNAQNVNAQKAVTLVGTDLVDALEEVMAELSK